MYFENINNEKITLPYIVEGGDPVWHRYVIRTKNRDKLQSYLESHNIQAMPHYPVPIHKQKAYSELSNLIGKLPVTETTSDEILSLPIYQDMPMDDVFEVINKLNLY